MSRSARRFAYHQRVQWSCGIPPAEPLRCFGRPSGVDGPEGAGPPPVGGVLVGPPPVVGPEGPGPPPVVGPPPDGPSPVVGPPPPPPSGGGGLAGGSGTSGLIP